MMILKDERPTSNIERPTSNENKKPIPNRNSERIPRGLSKIPCSKLRGIFNYFCFYIFSNSKFDVGRSMFDVHSFSSVKTI